MQVDDVTVTGAAVQPVDVLGDEPVEATVALHVGEQPVTGVGLGSAHPAPADVRPGPVALLGLRPLEKSW